MRMNGYAWPPNVTRFLIAVVYRVIPSRTNRAPASANRYGPHAGASPWSSSRLAKERPARVPQSRIHSVRPHDTPDVVDPVATSTKFYASVLAVRLKVDSHLSLFNRQLCL